MANAKISELPLLQKLGNLGAAPDAARSWDFAYTWDDAGTTFVCMFLNVTNTNSAGGSLIADWRVDNVSMFNVDATGALTVVSVIRAAAYYGPAGLETGLLASVPEQITTAQAGTQVDLVASDAVPGSSVAGAAAGGDVLIQAGNAARLTSGNANGGDINLVTGAGIGTGTAGQVLFPNGVVAKPGLAFTADSTTGIYTGGGGAMRFAVSGVQQLSITSSVAVISGLTGNASSASISGFKVAVAATTSGTENGTNSFGPIQTNTGATGLNTRTLPGNGTGEIYRYYVTDTDGIRVQGNTGDTIRVIDKVTAAGGYIESTTIGSYVEVLALDSSTWVAINISGVWTDGTFTYDDTSLTTP